MFGSLKNNCSLLLLLLDICNGFSTHRCVPSSRNIIIRGAAASSGGEGGESVGVQLVSLKSLGTDHDAVGEAMARSVAAWLDVEWMPQEIHIKMGTSVKNSYISCRKRGIEEVAEIMTQVTEDLYDKWSEYNADAFVNAWDVGNYVADYLIAKSGSETCGCSTKIVDPDLETAFE
jgi:hypothetical protein